MSSEYHNRLIWIKNLFLKWIAFAFQVLVEDFFYIRKKYIYNTKLIQLVDNTKCIRPDNAKCFRHLRLFFHNCQIYIAGRRKCVNTSEPHREVVIVISIHIFIQFTPHILYEVNLIPYFE